MQRLFGFFFSATEKQLGLAVFLLQDELWLCSRSDTAPSPVSAIFVQGLYRKSFPLAFRSADLFNAGSRVDIPSLFVPAIWFTQSVNALWFTRVGSLSSFR